VEWGIAWRWIREINVAEGLHIPRPSPLSDPRPYKPHKDQQNEPNNHHPWSNGITPGTGDGTPICIIPRECQVPLEDGCAIRAFKEGSTQESGGDKSVNGEDRLEGRVSRIFELHLFIDYSPSKSQISETNPSPGNQGAYGGHPSQEVKYLTLAGSRIAGCTLLEVAAPRLRYARTPGIAETTRPI
jgi:hypothetical protein